MIAIALALVVMLLPTMPLEAQQKPTEPSTGAKASTEPVYKPPMRGAPGGRVGGGTRGTGREAFVLSVVAPTHTGLTTSEQPELFWFISSASSYPVEFTVVDSQKTDPLLELRIEPPVKAGFHKVRLADHGVRLQPGVSYQWFVAVVPDSGRRSKDILAGGSIERVSPPDGLEAKIARARRNDVPAMYAEAGLWYDAVSALGELIDRTPTDRALLDQRSALMRQVGLPETRTE
jgi:hypothetical protein